MVAQLIEIFPRILRKLRFITQFMRMSFNALVIQSSPKAWTVKLHSDTVPWNPFQYYPPTFPQPFWMDSFLPVFQSKICSRLLSLPFMPHSLPILRLFFDTLVSDKQCKLWNSTKCILFCPIPLSLVQTLFLSLILKHKQLINGKKHSQVLKALFSVIRSIHLLTSHNLTNKID